MKTRPPTIAADDLTGPPVLKLQSSDNLSGRFPAATPVRAGLPRNIIHPAASPDAALPSRLSDAPEVASRLVAVAAKIQAFEWPDFIREFLCTVPGIVLTLEGFSTGVSIQHGPGFGNLIIPIRITWIPPERRQIL